jgi:hypothetical protein
MKRDLFVRIKFPRLPRFWYPGFCSVRSPSSSTISSRSSPILNVLTARVLTKPWEGLGRQTKGADIVNLAVEDQLMGAIRMNIEPNIVRRKGMG